MGLILSAALTGCAFLTNSSNPTIIKSIYDGDTKMWNQIFAQQPDSYFDRAPGGVILPHHMIVASELSKTYHKLAEVMQPSVVVIISPNHYQDGNGLIQTCVSCEYQTVNSKAPIETSLAKKLIRSGLATNEPTTFIKEHGIFSHAPFIKNFFPQAKILPIMLKWETPIEKTTELSEWLNANIPENALVIASVDFSHYIPIEHANFHDISSYATIKNFDYQNIYDLEIDSPPSISTITHLMEKRGYMDAQRFAHTNNQQFQPSPIPETTSHQFISFFKGEKQPEKSINIMSFGSIPEDQKKNDNGTKLSLYDNYRWNINWPNGVENNKATNLNPWLRDFRGKEDRMLVGADFLVFGVPEICTQKTQNGIHISFCKLKTSQAGQTKDMQKWISLLEGERKLFKNDAILYIELEESDRPLSVTHWKQTTRKFAEKGKTIIIGTGTKLLTNPSIEKYRDSIIIRSLGEFIIPPGIKNTVGSIAEITVKPDEIKAQIYPIDILNGYPQLPFKASQNNPDINPIEKG